MTAVGTVRSIVPELAVLPGVLLQDRFGREAHAIFLDMLATIFESGFVADINGRGWSRFVTSAVGSPGGARARKIVAQLAKDGRLVPRDPVLESLLSDEDWLQEAKASHRRSPLTGILALDRARDEDSEYPVYSIGELFGSPLFPAMSTSMTLKKRVDDYEIALGTILRLTNAVMFIDPFLDPRKGLDRILRLIGARKPTVHVEMHTAIHKRERFEGDEQIRMTPEALEAIFRKSLAPVCDDFQLPIHLTIWERFHDRYLITRQAGFSLPHGFYVDPPPEGETTWSRLSREDRRRIQHDPVPGKDALLRTTISPTPGS